MSEAEGPAYVDPTEELFTAVDVLRQYLAEIDEGRRDTIKRDLGDFTDDDVEFSEVLRAVTELVPGLLNEHDAVWASVMELRVLIDSLQNQVATLKRLAVAR